MKYSATLQSFITKITFKNVIVDTFYLPDDRWVEFSRVKVTAVEGGSEATFTHNGQAGAQRLLICSQQPDHMGEVVSLFFCLLLLSYVP